MPIVMWGVLRKGCYVSNAMHSDLGIECLGAVCVGVGAAHL
jgi:hypothetical protein